MTDLLRRALSGLLGTAFLSMSLVSHAGPRKEPTSDELYATLEIVQKKIAEYDGKSEEEIRAEMNAALDQYQAKIQKDTASGALKPEQGKRIKKIVDTNRKRVAKIKKDRVLRELRKFEDHLEDQLLDRGADLAALAQKAARSPASLPQSVNTTLCLIFIAPVGLVLNLVLFPLGMMLSPWDPFFFHLDSCYGN